MENQNTDYKQPEERLPENDLPQDVEDSSRQKKELDQEIHSTENGNSQNIGQENTVKHSNQEDQEKVDPDHNKQSDSGIEGQQQQPKQQSEEATTEHPTRDLPEHEQRGSSPQNDGQTEVENQQVLKKEVQDEQKQENKEEKAPSLKTQKSGDGNISEKPKAQQAHKSEETKRAENAKKSTKGPISTKPEKQKTSKGEPPKENSKGTSNTKKDTKAADANKSKNQTGSKTDLSTKQSDSKNSQKKSQAEPNHDHKNPEVQSQQSINEDQKNASNEHLKDETLTEKHVTHENQEPVLQTTDENKQLDAPAENNENNLEPIENQPEELLESNTKAQSNKNVQENDNDVFEVENFEEDKIGEKKHHEEESPDQINQSKPENSVHNPEADHDYAALEEDDKQVSQERPDHILSNTEEQTKDDEDLPAHEKEIKKDEAMQEKTIDGNDKLENQPQDQKETLITAVSTKKDIKVSKQTQKTKKAEKVKNEGASAEESRPREKTEKSKIDRPPRGNTEQAFRDTHEIEQNIRKHRLQEVIKQKKILEEKLKGLQDQIQELHHSVEPVERTSPKPKKHIASKEEEELLKQKAEELVKKMQEEKKRREAKRAHLKAETSSLNFDPHTRGSNDKQEELHKNHRERSREERLYGGFSSSSTKNIVPLFKQWEHSAEEQQLQELERRKKALAERREFYRPFKDKELVEFGLKYQSDKKFIELEKKKEHSDDSKAKIMATKKYESKLLKQVQEYDEELKTAEEKKELERKILQEKKIQYAKAVKDMYLPKINKERASIMQDNIKSIIERAEAIESYDNYWRGKQKRPFKSKRNPKALLLDPEEGHSSGGENKYSSKDFYNKTVGSKESTIERNADSVGARESLKDAFLPKSQGHSTTSKKKPGVFKITGKVTKKSPKRDEELGGEKAQDDHPDETQAKKNYPNYIVELKKKREEDEKKGLKLKKQPWERHLKDNKLTYAEKVSYVLEDVKSIEEMAKEKEAWLKRNAKVGAKKDTKEEQDQVDDMYIDSIKAKIEVLRGIQP